MSIIRDEESHLPSIEADFALQALDPRPVLPNVKRAAFYGTSERGEYVGATWDRTDSDGGGAYCFTYECPKCLDFVYFYAGDLSKRCSHCQCLVVK